MTKIDLRPLIAIIFALTVVLIALFVITIFALPMGKYPVESNEFKIAPQPTPTLNVMTFSRTYSFDYKTSLYQMEHAENAMKKLSEK